MSFRCIAVLCCLFLTVRADGFSRQITTQYNPNCTQCDSIYPKPHLMYTRAVSDSNKDNVMHYVVSAGGGLGPLTSVLIQSSGKNSRLTFNWNNLLSKDAETQKHGIRLEHGTANYQAAFIVMKLWEYNDTDNSGDMTKAFKHHTPWHQWNTDDFVWTVKSREDIEKNHVMELNCNQTHKRTDNTTLFFDAEAEDEDYDFSMNHTTVSPVKNQTTALPTSTPTSPPSKRDLFHSGSKLQFRVEVSGKTMRPDNQPRLQFTGNSSQIDVILDHLLSSFPGSRFAISVVHLISLDKNSGTTYVEKSHSVDDEFTPGIFNIYDWNGVPNKIDASNKYDRSYLQWKPVCYTTPERHLKKSQQMYYFMQQNGSDTNIIDQSAVFNSISTFLTMGVSNAMNISFGQTNDGFYTASNYTTWTASMGLGEPPADKVSLLVILIIVIGLGLPFLLIIAGSIYICIRRRRESPSPSYEVIN